MSFINRIAIEQKIRDMTSFRDKQNYIDEVLKELNCTIRMVERLNEDLQKEIFEETAIRR